MLNPSVSEEKTKPQRQPTFDYLKGFAILFMVIIHVFDLWTIRYENGGSPLIHFMEFLGGPLAAPIFMFAMGLGMVYSRHNTPKELFFRGLKIFIAGYVLNVARYALSYLITGMIYGYFETSNFLYFLLNVDILQFAGLSFMLTALLKRIGVPIWGMTLLAVLMQTVGSALRFSAVTEFQKYFFGLFVYNGEYTCFPFLSWYIYPVAGMLFAGFLRQSHDADRWHKGTLLATGMLLIGILGACGSYQIDPLLLYTTDGGAFYAQNFLSTFFVLNVVVFSESVVYFVFKKLRLEKFKKLLVYLSVNLNTIYIVHWIIIGNAIQMLPSGLPVWTSFPLGFVITAIAAFLAKYLNKYLKV